LSGHSAVYLPDILKSEADRDAEKKKKRQKISGEKVKGSLKRFFLRDDATLRRSASSASSAASASSASSTKSSFYGTFSSQRSILSKDSGDQTPA
jgi:hypothetical protein